MGVNRAETGSIGGLGANLFLLFWAFELWLILLLC